MAGIAMIIGIDFRANLGFATDPNANYVALLGVSYPTTLGGVVMGWESGYSAGNERDRNAPSLPIDARLSGINFTPATVATFRVDLPSTGTYSIQAAIGDDQVWNGLTAELFDDANSLGTLVTGGSNLPGATGAGWFGADGALYHDVSSVTTASNLWAAANTVDGGGAAQITKTFSSTILRLKIGDGANFTTIAHLFITGPSVTPPPVTGPANVYFDTIF